MTPGVKAALIACGHSNLEIADRLVLTEATVKTHVSNVLRKIDVRDRVQAVVWAYEHGVVRRPMCVQAARRRL